MSTRITSQSQSSEPSTPRSILWIALAFAAMTIILVVTLGLTRPDSSTQAGSIEFVQATQQVTLGKDMIVTAGNVVVYLPREAMSRPGTISVTPRQANLFPSVGDTVWTRPQVINVEYQDPSGQPYPLTNFLQPVEICFQLTADQWQDYTQRPNAYQVQYYAETETPPHWVLMPASSHPVQSQFCGQTLHLSLFALAVQQDIGIPNTGATGFPTQSSPTRNPTRQPYEP